MTGFRKWLEKRIETLEAEHTRLQDLLLQVFSDDVHEERIERLVNAGVKLKAYTEVLDYLNTHEDTR